MEKKDLANVKLGIVFLYLGFFIYTFLLHVGLIYSNEIINLLGGKIEYLTYIRTLLAVLPFFSIFILIGIWLYTSTYLNIWGIIFLKKTLRTLTIIYFVLALSILYSALTHNLENAVILADLKTIIWRISLSLFLIFTTLYYYYFKKKNYIVFTLICLVLSVLHDVHYYSTKLTQLDNSSKDIDPTLFVSTVLIFLLLSANIFIFYHFISIQYRIKKN